MHGQFRSIPQTAVDSLAAQIRRTITFTKVTIVSLGFITTSLVPMAAFPGIAHADTDCSPNGIAYASSSWSLVNGGVNICNHPGDGSNVYVNNVNGQSTLTGTKWQCVEMVNRLYLTKGWIASNWYGNGGGSDGLIYHLPTGSGLTAQFNGSISYINPGDVITLNYGTLGHAGIIDSISGTTYNILNQNADLKSSAYVSTGSLSSGNATLQMNAWAGYTVQGVIHSQTTPVDNTVLQVKKLTQSDGTNEVIWSKNTNVNESWWNSNSNGVQVGNLIHISQADITSFDINLYSNGEHDLFTATAHNIWETWWYPGQGMHTTEILANIGNIKKIIKSVGPDGVTQQLYVLMDTGAYEYWWNSGSNGIQHDTIMTLANPVDEYKEIEPDGSQALFIADQNYPYEQRWGGGLSGIQQTTFSSIAGITSISFSQSSGTYRLYIGASSGAIREASWQTGGSINYWNLTGGAPVVQLQKWEDDSEQVLYEATSGGVFEYYWPTGTQTLGSDTIKGSLSSVHSFVRSTDPGGVQSVYTATGTNILESWWIPGGNGITTGQIE